MKQQIIKLCAGLCLAGSLSSCFQEGGPAAVSSNANKTCGVGIKMTFRSTTSYTWQGRVQAIGAKLDFLEAVGFESNDSAPIYDPNDPDTNWQWSWRLLTDADAPDEIRLRAIPTSGAQLSEIHLHIVDELSKKEIYLAKLTDLLDKGQETLQPDPRGEIILESSAESVCN